MSYQISSGIFTMSFCPNKDNIVVCVRCQIYVKHQPLTASSINICKSVTVAYKANQFPLVLRGHVTYRLSYIKRVHARIQSRQVCDSDVYIYLSETLSITILRAITQRAIVVGRLISNEELRAEDIE